MRVLYKCTVITTTIQSNEHHQHAALPQCSSCRSYMFYCNRPQRGAGEEEDGQEMRGMRKRSRRRCTKHCHFISPFFSYISSLQFVLSTAQLFCFVFFAFLSIHNTNDLQTYAYTASIITVTRGQREEDKTGIQNRTEIATINSYSKGTVG